MALPSWFRGALGAALALGAAGGGQAAPSRLASLNLCTDELLLALAAPGQIVSLSHLSHMERETPYWRTARRYARNDGSLLSLVKHKPDLIVTMGSGGRDTERLARRIGARLLALPYWMSLADMKTGIGTVAAALGHRAAGNRFLRQIAALERARPAPLADTIWLSGKGVSMPATGLGAEWMRLAGLKQRALPGDRATLEELLVRPPAVLLRSDYRSSEYSGDQQWLAHPLARRARGGRTIATDGRRWTCMGPSLIPEITRIKAEARR